MEKSELFTKYTPSVRRLENMKDMSNEGLSLLKDDANTEPIDSFSCTEPYVPQIGMDMWNLVEVHELTKGLDSVRKQLVAVKLMSSVQCGCLFEEDGIPYYGTVGGWGSPYRYVELRNFCCVCNSAAFFNLRFNIPTYQKLCEARLWKRSDDGVFYPTRLPIIDPNNSEEDVKRVVNNLRNSHFTDKLKFRRSFFYQEDVKDLVKRAIGRTGKSMKEVTKLARVGTMKELKLKRSDYFTRTDMSELRLLEETGRLDTFAKHLLYQVENGGPA